MTQPDKALPTPPAYSEGARDGRPDAAARDTQLQEALARTAKFLAALGPSAQPASAPARPVTRAHWGEEDSADEGLYSSEELTEPPAKPYRPTAYLIPQARGFSPARWYGADKNTGLYQVGGSSVIDPSRKVASFGDYRNSVGPRPSYETMPDSARRAYLDWLANGRKDAAADLAHPMLFLDGLEYRVLVEGEAPAFERDRPAIETALHELLAVYGPRAPVLGARIEGLLERIYMLRRKEQLYADFNEGLLPYAANSALARIALAQAARDKATVQSDLAFAWVCMQGDTITRAPLSRCPGEVRRAFSRHFHKHFPAGLELRPGRYPVESRYMPSSMTVGTYGRTPEHLRDLRYPAQDTRVLLGLQGLVGVAQDELEPYSRFIGRFPQLAGTPAAFVHAPRAAWPAGLSVPWEALAAQVRDNGSVRTTVEAVAKFVGLADAPAEVRRTAAVALAQVLAEFDILPVCAGDLKTKPFSDSGTLVLLQASAQPSLKDLAPYRCAIVLGLRAFQACNGSSHETDRSAVTAELQAWDISAPLRHRLDAIASVVVIDKSSAAGNKKDFEALSAADQAWALAAAVRPIKSTTHVGPGEVKALLKLARSLGVVDQGLYDALHQADSGRNTRPAPSAPVSAGPSSGDAKTSFLDASRIQALQEETIRTQAMLGAIFVSDESEPLEAPSIAQELSTTAAATDASVTGHCAKVTGVLGLDLRHSTIAMKLSEKPVWEQADLRALAKEQSLLFEGVIEVLNDAAFEAIDAPFFDSEDPFELNPEITQHLKP